MVIHLSLNAGKTSSARWTGTAAAGKDGASDDPPSADIDDDDDERATGTGAHDVLSNKLVDAERDRDDEEDPAPALLSACELDGAALSDSSTIKKQGNGKM